MQLSAQKKSNQAVHIFSPCGKTLKYGQVANLKETGTVGAK
jgi:hypothetical protein